MGAAIVCSEACMASNNAVLAVAEDTLESLPQELHRRIQNVRVVASAIALRSSSSGSVCQRLRVEGAFLVEDKSQQIVAVLFALETESAFRLLVGGFCPVLRRALLLACLDDNFLSVESRATLVSKLYRDVVVEFIGRRASANISSTDLASATKA
jgi:hypothetical protein